jgi:hypothetical protein
LKNRVDDDEYDDAKFREKAREILKALEK